MPRTHANTDPYEVIAELAIRISKICDDADNTPPIPLVNQEIEDFCREYGIDQDVCRNIKSKY